MEKTPWRGEGKDPGPQAGVHDSSSTQSQREAAYFAMAKLWGLERDFPRCDLLIIEGKQYACMHLLPFSYKTMQKAKEKDLNSPKKFLEPYRQRGDLHRWALIDAVLANPDRHAQNMMVNEDGDVKLIDHGSAFAGRAFDPAKDSSSFTPFYLRYSCPDAVNFNTLPPQEKLKYMQRAPADGLRSLGLWLDGLKEGDLRHVLPLYGIDPGPEIERLARIRDLAQHHPLDLAINLFWVET